MVSRCLQLEKQSFMTVIYDLLLTASGSHTRASISYDDMGSTYCEEEVVYDRHRRYQLL
jgi:hypothetical protein